MFGVMELHDLTGYGGLESSIVIYRGSWSQMIVAGLLQGWRQEGIQGRSGRVALFRTKVVLRGLVRETARKAARAVDGRRIAWDMAKGTAMYYNSRWGGKQQQWSDVCVFCRSFEFR